MKPVMEQRVHRELAVARARASARRFALQAGFLLSLAAPLPVLATIDVNKSFNPIDVVPGQTSQLTIVINNSGLTPGDGLAFVDTLPTSGNGDVIAQSLTSYTCTNADGSAAATTGSISIAPNTQISLSGGTLPGSDGTNPGNCRIVVTVSSAAAGTHINSIPAGGVTTTDQGSSPQSASATLFVANYASPTGTKTVSATSVHGNQTVDYTVTLNNSNQAPLTGVAFSDALPADLVSAAATPVSNSCGGSVAAAVGATNVSLTGGTIPANGTCALVFGVLPVSNSAAIYAAQNNTLPAGNITTAQGVSVTTDLTASVVVQTGGSVEKSFAPTTILADGQTTSTLTLLLLNRDVLAISGASLTDVLPTNVVVAPVPAISTVNCAPTISAAPGATSIAISGADLPAADTGLNDVGICKVTVNVVANPFGAAASYTVTNNIPAGSFGSTPANLAYPATSATLTGTNAIRMSKAFAPANIEAGGVTTATLTIRNTSSQAASISSLIDNITGTMGTGFVVASPANASSTCAGAAFAPTPGAGTATVTAGTVPANGNCTISFNIQVPPGATLGTHTNTANVVTTLGRAGAPGNVIVQSALSASKTFSPASVPVGTVSTLTLTIHNGNSSTQSGLGFTDNLTSMDAGGNVLVASAPAPTNTCGGTLTVSAGTSSFSLAGGAIAASSSCTITVPVVGQNGVPLGLRTNTIPVGAITSSSGSNASAVTGNLRFTAPNSVSKSFVPATVPQGAASTLTITLGNTSAQTAAITSFSDNLSTMGSGFSIAAAPAATTNCVGSSLTAGPGTTSISLSGGTISPAANCTITVPVQVTGTAAPGTATNTVAVGALVTSLGSNTVTATAPLGVTAGVSIAKSFSPSSFNINQAGVTQLLFTVTNPPSGQALTGLGVSDNLNGTLGAGYAVAAAPNLSSTCGGTVAAAPGAGSWSLAGGNLPANSSCTVALSIQVPANASGTTTTNTVPAGAVTDDQGVSNSAPATASLTFSKAPNLQVLNKTFVPDVIDAGATSQLQIVFVNTQAGASNLTNVSLTDSFPTGIIVAGVPSPTFTGTGCSVSGFSGNPGDNSYTLSGASIAAQTTCTLTVNVTSYVDGDLTNTIPAGTVTSDQGASNPNTVSKTLQVNRNVNIAKYFSPHTIPVNGTSTLNLGIFNTAIINRTGCTNFTAPCTQAYFSQDTLPAGITVASGTITNTCSGAVLEDGSGNALAAGATAVRIVGGTYAPRAECRISVPVTGTATGSYVNTIASNTVQTNEASTNPDATSDSLTILAPPSIAKAFGPSAIGIGGTSTLTFTLGNSNSSALLAGGFTSAGFTDPLAGMAVATPGPAGGTCAGAASNQFAAGATSLAFSGLAIPPAASCTVTVAVTSGAAGSYPNTASGVSSAQNPAAGPASNTATLSVNALPSIAKAFGTPSLGAGQKTTLSFTLSNANAVALTLSAPAFTDLFPTSPGPMTLADTVTSTTCTGASITNNTGGALAVGSPGIRVSGGTLPASGSCTVTVDVTATTLGLYQNTTGVLSTVNGGSSTAGASANLTVGNGQPLSGFVYLDANDNLSLDAGENWSAGVPVFINLVQGGAIVQSTTVNPGSGAYSFPAVAAGSYTLVLGNSAAATTASAPAGFNFTAPSNGALNATVGNSPALNYDFGLLSGGNVSGTVFRDTGPVANNGIQDSPSAEPGESGVAVQLTNCSGTVYGTATTDGNGNYSLPVPGGVANGASVCVAETNPASYLSTGASVGTVALPSGSATSEAGTSYTYTKAVPAVIQFSYSSSTRNFPNLNFGLVPPNSFTTDNQQSALPGTVAYYAHQFSAGTAGTVTFSTTAVDSPGLTGWVEVLYLDSGCTGQIQPSDSQITAPIALAAGQKICILDREFVPAGAPTGALNTVTVTANFSYSNASPAFADVQKHTDVTTVGQPSGSDLTLIKSVDQPTATPGSVLTYTLTYTNNSSAALQTIIVNDATPSYTIYVGGSAQCLPPVPMNLTGCSVTTQPANGATGPVQWSMTGTLAPGASGKVRYQVTVQN